MIPRIICFIFGHKRRSKAYSDRDIAMSNEQYSYFHWVYYNFCPRCGKKKLTMI